MACSEWKVPWAPVKALADDLGVAVDEDGHLGGFLHGFDDLLGSVAQMVGGQDRQAGIP